MGVVFNRKASTWYYNQCKCEISTLEDGIKRKVQDKYYSYKYNSNKKNRDFELTQKEFFDLILNHRCFWCGGFDGKFLLGIDRLDSTKGYIKGNCVPCCFSCNKMKGVLSDGEFLYKINKISEKWAKTI